MQKITPFLWYDGKAEEAATFYTSIFPNSRITDVMRYSAAGPGPQGTVMSVSFQLDGQDFMALNGGSCFSFSPAISFFVSCETQDEVDALWDRLGTGGKPMQCGWLTDRFGVTWQVVPSGLRELLQDPDPERSSRVMQALMQMIKLDIAALRRAYDGQ